MSYKVEQFGTTEGRPVELVTLETEPIPIYNNLRASVQLCAYGAAVVSFRVPGYDDDKKLCLADIVLGFKEFCGYESNLPYLGVVVGRVAGRISNACFKLPSTGELVNLTRNALDTHCLHGGRKGLSHVLWTIEDHSTNSVTFNYTSPPGSDGFPGEMLIKVLYTLAAESGKIALQIDYTATLLDTTHTECPISVTNHATWNLAGHDSGPGELLEHEVLVNADRYVELDPVNLIPTGNLISVESDTNYDLRTPRLLSSAVHTIGDGRNPRYDVYYVFRKNETNKPRCDPVAVISHASTGRRLRVYTDQPGAQFYTGHYINPITNHVGKHGAAYEPSGGFCFETQGFPNACNQPSFPTTFIEPGGKLYTQKTVYELDVC